MDLIDMSRNMFECAIIVRQARRKNEQSYYRMYSIDEEYIHCVEILDKNFNMSKDITLLKVNDYGYSYEYSDASRFFMINLGFNRKWIKSTGGVYLLKCDGIYKIGRSKNIVNRIKSIANQKGSDVDLIAYHRTLGHYETRIHKLYDKESIGGEWFNLNDMQVNEFLSKDFLNKITL